ncbi:MAG: hypothetical protein R3F60_21095 [bacterium]
MRRALWAVVLACALPAQAAPAAPGVVMRVDDQELFVNLGHRDGVRAGSRLSLYRRVVLTHPLSGAEVEDRFPIGVVEVAEAGELLSIVRDFGRLKRSPAPGDYVDRDGPAPAVTPVPVAGADPGGKPVEADLVALHATLLAGMGHAPEAQAEGLKAWRRAFPESKRGDAVELAIRELEAQAATPPPTSPRGPDDGALAARHVPVPAVEAGRSLEVTVAVVQAEEVDEVHLLVRAGRPADLDRAPRTWRTVMMTRAGDYYWRAAMPPELLAQPGQVEYALEAVRMDGRSEALAGDLLRPLRVTVSAMPVTSRQSGPSHAEIFFRYVDFNVSEGGDDRYYQTEARFRYGVRFGFLHAVEVGVGLLNGRGGRVKFLDDGGDPRSVSLGYAFGAVELAVSPALGLGARLVGGNARPGAGEEGTSVIGAQGYLRIGEDDSTHLIVGAGGDDTLGSRYFADLHIDAFDRVPLRAGAEATNLPVDADYGVRLTGAVGYRVADWATLLLETGWNARTINHYGFTGGAGVALDWE